MTDANEYGKALFLITEEDAMSDTVLTDVKIAESIFKSNPDYVKLLDSPVLKKEERVELVDRAFGSLNVNLMNLIKILTEKREVHLFDKIATAYYGLYDQSRGIVRVEAITAIPLTKEQSDAIARKLASMLGKKIFVTNVIDRSILGGVKLRYSGIQLDGSVKTRLDKFDEAIKNTVID